MKHIKALGILSCGVLAFAALQPALAQTSTATMQGIDLSGNWSAVNSTDANMDMPGAEPGPVDYLGVPLNAASRQAAEIFSLDQLAEPELQCAYYSQVYTMLGPFGLRIYTVVEPLDGGTIAWVVGGWDDKRQMFIWMDGRPHPSNIAPHEMGGFTTGKWQDDVLVSYTTHMRKSIVRRNGTPLSDHSEMTMWFFRHGGELTLMARITDPVYLTQPYMMTRTFRLFNAGPMNVGGVPCVITNEGTQGTAVPFYPPGHNPFMTETGKIYGIPQDAVLGGAKTMYPDYRKYLKDKYVRPPECPSRIANPFSPTVCGGPGTVGESGGAAYTYFQRP